MDRISRLSDELLIKILSFLPTKVAVSTSILSKQWEFLWMWLPNLEFVSTNASDSETLERFLLRNLALHRAPVIKSFCLKIHTSYIEPKDVKLLVLLTVSRDVHELEISYPCYGYEKDILPSSLYTCKFLSILKLEDSTLVDVPRMVYLPSLKTLRLHKGSYVSKDSLQRLLSNCPVLEDLLVCGFADMGNSIVMGPSLERLSLEINDEDSEKYLKLDYFHCEHLCISIKNMPKLKEAFLEVSFMYVKRLIRSISSVERLTLCISFCNLSEALYDDGFVFHKLKHLKLCVCQHYSADVLFQLLKVSPNLRVLEFFIMNDHIIDPEPYWNQPSTVPECMLFSLQTFKWSEFDGNKEEKELVIYILQNARRLKTATILPDPVFCETLDMLCVLGNLCPEIVEEAVEMVPSLKTKGRGRDDEAIEKMINDLSLVKRFE